MNTTNLNTIESDAKNSCDVWVFLTSQTKSMKVWYKEADNLDWRDTVFNRDVHDIFSSKTWKKLLTLHIRETESRVTLSLIQDPEVMKNKERQENLHSFDRTRNQRGLGTKMAFLTMLYCIFKKKDFFTYPSTSGSNYWKRFDLPRDPTRSEIQILSTNPEIEVVTKYVIEQLMHSEEIIKQNQPIAQFRKILISTPDILLKFIKRHLFRNREQIDDLSEI